MRATTRTAPRWGRVMSGGAVRGLSGLRTRRNPHRALIVAIALRSEIESLNIEAFRAAIFHMSVSISLYSQEILNLMLTVEAYLSLQNTCCNSRIGGSSASCEHSGGASVNPSSAQTSCCNPLEDMEMDIPD